MSNGNYRDIDELPTFSDRLKQEFALAISGLVESYDLTPLQAAAIMKTSSTDVDDILDGKLDGFTVNWLMKAHRTLRWRLLTSASPNSFMPN